MMWTDRCGNPRREPWQEAVPAPSTPTRRWRRPWTCSGARGTKTSLYAAYGNKEELFRKVLDRYGNGPAGYLLEAVRKPTARAVAEHVLRGAAVAGTLPGRPTGCLAVQGALAPGMPDAAAHKLLTDWRKQGERRIRERFRAARAEGDLPPDSDPSALARYVFTVAYGVAVQAASGVPRGQLQETVQLALRAWPS
jgi:AcrR family transcriptional regulator